MAWAEEEFSGIDLGDKRLNKRAVQLAEQLAANPTASIPQACGGWAETQAAYRFTANDGIGWEDILTPHWRCATERMRMKPVVLCIQDTSEADFNGQTIAGLGPLSYEAQRGMLLHLTYAVSPDREPLGVLDAWMWARGPKGEDGSRGGIVESTRWLDGYERVAEQAANLPGTRLVYVADREADILALLVRARDLGNPADWLIRSRHNRALPEGGKLWAEATGGEALGEVRFTLPSRAGHPARQVRQRLWARRVEISDGQGGRVAATCIVAREEHPPQGVRAVEWRLLTNRQAETFEAAAELIDWYRALGDRALLPRTQERLPGGGLAARHRGAHGTCPGAVPGGGLAHRLLDAPGPHLPGSGCGALVRAQRVGGGLPPEPQEATEAAAQAQRGDPPGGPARRLPGPQGRRRAGREDPLARPATHHGLRHGAQLRSGNSCGLSCV